MHTFGFILEQGLGHRTHALNLQAHIHKAAEVQARWGLIEHQTSGLLAHIPFLTRNWTLEAGVLVRRALAQMAQHGPLDALFFHTQVMAVLASKWLKRIPSIISLDATPLQYDGLGKVYNHQRDWSWIEEQKWRLNRNCFHQARALVTWSSWAKASLVADYDVPAAKVTVIPPGIQVQAWQRPQPRRQQEQPVKILFVGGDLERKGGLDLIEAFRHLYDEFIEAGKGSTRSGHTQPALELHLVTKDQLPATVLRADGEIAQPGLYHHQGLTPNSEGLKALFHSCDIFCLPTHGDCLPLALVEASAAGLPSITTEVGGTAEVVEEGRNGFLIPIGDRQALVERLRLLIANPQLRLQQGDEASTIAMTRFDAEQTTGHLLTLLKAATERPVHAY